MRASAAQRGLWAARAVAPADTAAFTIGHLVDFSGPVDADRLTTATATAIGEADGLRSVFADDGGQITVTLDAEIPVTAQHLGEDPSAIDTHARSAVRVAFDLTTGPLARATILTAGQRISLLIVADHIVLDAYGIGLLTRRIAQLYTDARDERRLRSITTLPDEFDAPRDGDAAFWDAEVAGLDSPVTFTGTPRSHRVAHAVRTRRVVVRGASTYPTGRLVAAIGAFCARFADRSEVVLGFPMMNRLGSPAVATPCTLVNVVPLRLTTPPSAGLDDLGAAADERLRAIAAHARYRGEDILRAARRHGLDGLFGPTVNIKPFSATITFGTTTATLQSLARGPVVDLSITALDVDGSDGGETQAGVELLLDADANLYDDQRIDEIATALAGFVDQIHQTPARPIGAMSASPAVAATTLSAIGDTDARSSYPTDPTPVVDRILGAEPSSTAVMCGDDSISVAELDHRTATLASELGILDPEDTVAVALPRGIDLIVALIAVLRCGAAFVPLDPTFPAQRIAAAIDDADPVSIIEADESGAMTIRRRRSNRSRAVASSHREHPAYLIYTSGTTGTPKGVVIGHGALTNFTDAMIREIGYRPGTTVLAVTTISFDIAILETLVPLAAGATVVLASTSDVHDPTRLADLITRHGVDRMQATPSLWTALIDAGYRDVLHGVDVLVGGEQLPTELATVLLDAAASVRNMYGPTETTIWSTTSALRQGGAVTIGEPIENTGVRILDSALQPVSDGRVGELYLSGHGLARGYRNLPGLTASRFVADPCGTPGRRMYRTGDLARRTVDGYIECLGRTDHQVKIRGFRIELGEIEARLVEHPDVEHAVVSAMDGRLVAYLSRSPGVIDGPRPAVDADALRTHLADRLPDYMIPAGFIDMASFPTTANGKIDRRALPAPDFGALAGTGRTPGTDTERRLAPIFAEVLSLPGVGVDDNFFTLGGDSITAVRLVRRAADAGIVISPLEVFDHPTVAGLARSARTSVPTTAPPPPPPPAAVEHTTTAGIDDEEFDELIEGNLL